MPDILWIVTGAAWLVVITLWMLVARAWIAHFAAKRATSRPAVKEN